MSFQKFEDQQWQDPFPSQPAALNVDVRNVVITDVSTSNGTVDYFKYDPDGDASLQRPQFTFTIKDADPHKYAVIMRYRQTMGEGTWSWDTGGWSWYKKSLGTSMSGDLNLTQPGFDGECLNGDDHEWGTYTYDLIVLEFENEVPANDDDWTQANAMDWNFLKRYRDGYHLWVPENVPGTDEPGHDVWTQVPEDSNAELRGYYCLDSDWSSEQEAQVERGQDAAIIAVDPQLSEKSSTSGPGAVDTLGAE